MFLKLPSFYDASNTFNQILDNFFGEILFYDNTQFRMIEIILCGLCAKEKTVSLNNFSLSCISHIKGLCLV